MFRFSIDQIEEYAFDKKEFLIDNDALENVSQSFLVPWDEHSSLLRLVNKRRTGSRLVSDDPISSLLFLALDSDSC